MTFELINARNQCTEVRLRLYENGFTPLPNKNKMCLLPEWSKVEVTPDLIQSRRWNRSNNNRDTGLRCGDIVAIDWDVNDTTLINDMLDAVIANGIVSESDFIRVGKVPREMWIYRASDAIGKRTTGFFAAPGADSEEKPHQVEILGKGCQFAAYGMRDEQTPYRWPVKSLLDHTYMELPVITFAQVEAVKTFAVEFFEKAGLKRQSAEGGTDEGFTHVYDLTGDMVFDVKDLGDMSIDDIDLYLKSHPEAKLRAKMDTLRPGTSGSWAGVISLSDDRLCLSDYGSYSSHFRVDDDMDAKLVALGKRMLELAPSGTKSRFDKPVQATRVSHHGLSLSTEQSFEDNLSVALERFAYLVDTDTIADTMLNKFDMTVPHFKNHVQQYHQVETGSRGGQTITWLSEIWLRSPQRKNAKRADLRPDMPYPFFTEEGIGYLNTYRPHALPTTGDPAPGFDFIARLLPIEGERHYFLQWLAYKLNYPQTRGPGIIMVAHDTYGTGRGTLIEILKAFFAEGLARTIDFESLTGKGTQGQYNEWLADALLVAVNEAQEANNTSKWQVRQNAYEHLKNIVDPGHHDIYIKRKGLGNYQGKTYASIVVMTNHMDSVVLPSDDRRFAILENGAPQSPEYWDVFHAWRKVPENLGAFMQAIKDYPLEGYNPFVAPPMTHAKRDMVDAGESALDKAVADILSKLPGSLFTREQLILHLEDYLSDYAVEFPDEWRRNA
jgi:hypothetical protein